MRIGRSIAAAAVILGSSTVVLTGGTAHAASFSLKVSAITRTGTVYDTHVAHAVNVKTGDEFKLNSRPGEKVPAGTYSVGAMIYSGDETCTLAVRTVTVNKNTKVAFDARDGRKVSFTVDEPTAETKAIQLVPLVHVASVSPVWALNPPEDGVPVDKTYVVPASSKYLSLVAYGQLEQADASIRKPSPYRFDLAHKSTGGMPADVSFTARRADLAKVTSTVRSSGPYEYGDLRLSLGIPRTGATVPGSRATALGKLPAQVVSYRTPGFNWGTEVSNDGPAGSGKVRINTFDRPVYKKGATSETYRTAAWGPVMGGKVVGRHLVIWPRAYAHLAAPGAGGRLDAPGGRTVRLYRGSTLLGESTDQEVKVKLPTKTATYTLQVLTARGESDALSATTAVTWKFKARGYTNSRTSSYARILTAALTPRGLDASNTAARGSTTSVGLKFNASSMKSVAVEASFDGGTSWKTVTATRSGGSYVVKVANPDSAGMVSLRVKATESKGSSITQAILNAYGVR